MKQQNLLPGISLPAPRPSRPAETPPAPSLAAPAVPDTDTWSPQESLLHSAFVFEPAGTAAEPVLILGLDCAQPLREGLAPARLRLIEQADVLCGGRRLLAAFDDLPARQLPLTAPLEPVLARISHLRAGGKKVVVLADGDPLFYGIGTTLLRQLGPEAVRILPGVSSLQQACARLGLPWHDVICLSLHGRDDLTPLHTAVHRQRPISLLTDARMTPDLLARHLLDRGVDWFAMHVFEHMGSDGEQEHHLTLAEAAAARFGAVCTVLLTPAGEMRRPHPGLLPAELRHEDGLLTKPAVRAAALALLRPEPRHTVWDLGAGSGSVALEAACLAHEGRVVAVERTPSRALDIQENRRRFGAASVDVCLGTVPQCLPRLPGLHRRRAFRRRGPQPAGTGLPSSAARRTAGGELHLAGHAGPLPCLLRGPGLARRGDADTVRPVPATGAGHFPGRRQSCFPAGCGQARTGEGRRLERDIGSVYV